MRAKIDFFIIALAIQFLCYIDVLAVIVLELHMVVRMIFQTGT